MEFVESSQGFYPSTEGFLQLLKSLIIAGGFPTNLGSDWRVRSGSTPYIEYVINLVIPRAVGYFQNKKTRLPFRSVQDSNRLLSLALDVVESGLSRFSLITIEKFALHDSKVELSEYLYESTFTEAVVELGSENLANALVMRPDEQDADLFRNDFLKESAKQPRQVLPTGKGNLALSADSTNVPFFNNSKSPGFSILASLLSSSNENLLRAIVYALKEARTTDSVMESDKFSLAYGLYGATPPTLFSAKEGVENTRILTLFQTLLKPLLPVPDHEQFRWADYWEGRVVRTCLRLICSAVARESTWNRCLTASRATVSSVPYLNLNNQSVPESHEVRCAVIAQLLLPIDYEIGAISEIIECVKFGHTNSQLDVEIATAASSVVFYISRTLRYEQMNDILYQNIVHSSLLLSAFGARMIKSAEIPITKENADLLRMILSRHLDTLRSIDMATQLSLTHVMFDFHTVLNSKQHSLGTSQQTTTVFSSFDAILTLLRNYEFVTSKNSSFMAACCFEIIFRVTQSTNNSNYTTILSFAMRKLNEYDFWKTHMVRNRYVQSATNASENLDVVHSMAWLLKSVASELFRFSRDGLPGDLSCCPAMHYEILTSILFHPDGFIEYLLRILPLEMCNVPPSKVKISEDALYQSKTTIVGAVEVVKGFELVDTNKLLRMLLLDPTSDYGESITSWCNLWNHAIELDCASAHITQALNVLIGSVASARRYQALNHLSALNAGCHVLTCILNRFDWNQFFYESYFSAASRNLAHAALMSAKMVAVTAARQPNRMVEASTCCSMLAKAIFYSGATDIENTIVNERTCFFACALTVIVQQIPHKDLITSDNTDLVEASMVLARIACSLPSNDSKNFPRNLAQRGQTALLVVLDLFCKNSINFTQSLLTRITRSGLTVLKAMTNANMITHLSLITCVPDGCNHLFDSGILSYIEEVAMRYANTLFKGTIETGPMYLSNPQPTFSPPDYLLSHLQLLNAMMSSDFRPMIRQDLSSKILSILFHYKELFEHIILHFPIDMEILPTALKCISYAKLLNHGIDSGLRSSNEIVKTFDANFELHLARLSFRIAFHPLPIVQSVGLIATNIGLDPFDTIEQGPKWWDFLYSNEAPASDASNDGEQSKIPFAKALVVSLAAVDLLQSGFFIVRTSTVVEYVDGISLSKAVCQCVKSFRVSQFPVDFFLRHGSPSKRHF